jgi:AraC-like DNA-binding protein
LAEWNLQVFSVCHSYFREGEWDFLNVCSPFWRFYINERDGFHMWWTADGVKKRLDLRGGNSYFIPAGVSFSGASPGPTHHLYIHFDVLGPPPSMVSPVFRPLLSQPLEMEASLMTASLREGISHLSELCQESNEDIAPDMLTSLHAKAVLFAALAHCAKAWDKAPTLEPPGDVAAIEPALRYIELHLSLPISVEELASRCHFSTDHFSVRFRQATGQPPARYIRERRLNFAAQQLLFSSHSIEQIAQSCGFCDRFHFSRAFAKSMGVSPAAYRKTVRV